MRVISVRTIHLFVAKVPAARGPLSHWYRNTLKADWRNFPEVEQAFGQTDQAMTDNGHRVQIFDVGGNKWRLIAKISFEKSKVYILRILTHKEYDRELWKREL